MIERNFPKPVVFYDTQAHAVTTWATMLMANAPQLMETHPKAQATTLCP